MVILPVTLVATAISIISNLSDRIQLGNLSKFLKSSIIWVLGFITIMFTTILNLEGTITSTIDGVTMKGIKTVTTSAIPIVGKAMGDSVDTVIGCAQILKNAIGVIGVLIIIGICIIPIIKLTILSTLYKLEAAICEPLADKRIIKLLGDMGGTFKVLLAILFFMSILLIIGLGIVIKISNASFSYR